MLEREVLLVRPSCVHNFGVILEGSGREIQGRGWIKENGKSENGKVESE